MATFGWAYVDCIDIGPDCEGPTGSVQFLTGANALSGSSSFLYHTAAVHGYAASTLVLTGTLVVSGTISASMYHIKDIALIDTTGSTYFGDDQTDVHARTGSLELYSDTKKIYEITSPSAAISGSGTLHNVGAITSTGQIATTGSLVGNVLDIGGSDLTVTSNGNVSGSGTLYAAGAATFSSTLATTGSISGSSTLQIVGAITSTGQVATTGSLVGNVLDIGGSDFTVTPAGNVSGSGTLYAAGAATFSDTLATTGSITAGSTITAGGNVLPTNDNSQDLGSAAQRWANIYTGDLHLKNERGDWSVVEEEEYLSVINNKTGKKYKFVLEEIED